jgi:hypothetical protein
VVAVRVAAGIVDWLVPAVPAARVAWLRRVLAAFALLDATVFTNHVLDHVHVAAFWNPGVVGRTLQLPAPTSVTATAALVLVAAGCALSWTRRLGHLGWVCTALGYLPWVLWSMGFGYVAHDHMAIVVAVLALLSVGRADADDLRPSRTAGWALRCVQIATVMTYTGSALSKWVRSGTPAAWAEGAVTVWALTRRGNSFSRWLLEVPQFLVAVQWVVLVCEFLAPVALFLRRRLLRVALGAVVLFHLSTYLTLGIHFLPTVVCWAAFLPLERLSRSRGERTAPTRRPSTASPGPAR